MDDQAHEILKELVTAYDAHEVESRRENRGLIDTQGALDHALDRARRYLTGLHEGGPTDWPWDEPGDPSNGV